jgi:hypothetical protein
MKVGITNHTIFAHVTLTFSRFFSEDVPFESFLKSDFTGTGNLEALLGAAVCFYLWHYITVLSYSLLAFRAAGNLLSLVGNVHEILFGVQSYAKT